MVKAASVFAQTFTGLLSICGGYGNGKTTLLKAIANAALDRGVEVRYMTMKDVMDYAREAFDSQQAGDTDAGRITRLAKTRLLVIDEMDKARYTEYAREVQTHLFDVRYRCADELGTVVAWNGNRQSLPLPWVVSRLSQYPMIENNDADMRPLLGGAK
jgi:DNA replication protein DnaC